jgi:hypothetical protein
MKLTNSMNCWTIIANHLSIGSNRANSPVGRIVFQDEPAEDDEFVEYTNETRYGRISKLRDCKIVLYQ